MVVGAEATDGTGRNGHDRTRLFRPDALAIGPRADIDGILENARHRSIIFRREEQDRIDRLDAIPERSPRRRRRNLLVGIFVIQRQIPDFDDCQFQACRRQRGKGMGREPIIGTGPKAADDDGDVACDSHGLSPFTH